jgi:hypothetical protein
MMHPIVVFHRKLSNKTVSWATNFVALLTMVLKRLAFQVKLACTGEKLLVLDGELNRLDFSSRSPLLTAPTAVHFN